MPVGRPAINLLSEEEEEEEDDDEAPVLQTGGIVCGTVPYR